MAATPKPAQSARSRIEAELARLRTANENRDRGGDPPPAAGEDVARSPGPLLKLRPPAVRTVARCRVGEFRTVGELAAQAMRAATEPPPFLELTPLDHAPEPVTGHGLRAAHVAPRVGSRRGAAFWSGRVPARFAWAYPLIELANAGWVWATLTYDCDDRETMAAGLTDLPPFNWLTWTERGAHLTWCLAVPVAKHKAARPAPERQLARVSEYFHATLGADRGFGGLGRNPTHSDADTEWGREAPYGLDEMASVIPFGWKRPRVSQTGIGRNVDLFCSGLRWAGKSVNAGQPVLSALYSILPDVCEPYGRGLLPDCEIVGMARRIERYRAGWERGACHKAWWIEKQRAKGCNGGIRSGIKRLDRVADRDASITAAAKAGRSIRRIAKELGLPASTVQSALQRMRR